MKKYFKTLWKILTKKFSRRQIIAFGILIGLTVIIAVTAIFLNAQNTRGGRIVVFYVDDIEKVVITKAKTVSEAMKDGDISIGKHDFIEPKTDAALTDSMSFVNIRRARMITVINEGQKKRIITPSDSKTAIATAAGIKLYPEDDVDFTTADAFSDQLGASLEMRITPAKIVNLTLYGQNMTLRTQKKTVAELLKEKNIELTDDDGVSVPLDTPIENNMSFQIWRNGITTISVEEEVAFPVNEIPDDSKFVGFREVQSAGQNGKKTVIYEVEMQDGVEISRKKISEVIVEPAVPQTEIVGTKPRSVPWTGSVDKEAWLRAAGIAESDWGYVQYIIEHEGSWCPVRWQGDRSCMDHGAVAPSYLGYGMFQATPGTKMASAGADYLTNPVTQIVWANGYAVGRYGSWSAAYNFKISRGWW
ncbi:G5 domain-containing protein [Candidatus Saccharibacteria bacterium]|nr:G5 domain-containing protein [Candidatus Saccharibacteria bacterium]MCL1963113.1 G5 domain-containing protein [Candidatus Saccharibacteria bacterium]